MAVHQYGRLFFLVDSHSRAGLRHLVDLEPELDDKGERDTHGEPYKCSCESFRLRVDRPCRHCVEAYEFIAPKLKAAKLAEARHQVPPRRVRRYTLKAA